MGYFLLFCYILISLFMHNKKTGLSSFCFFILIALSTFLFSCGGNNDDVPPPPAPLLEDTLTAGWTKLNVPAGADIPDVFFYGNNNGFFIRNKEIYKSTDGGSNWQKVYHTSASLSNMGMANENIAFFTGIGNKIIITRNGGASFDSVILNDNYLQDVFCINATTAYAVGFKLWKTIDGGITWTIVHDFSSNTNSELSFFNESTGWVIGESFGLLKTTNGGVTWQDVNFQSAISGRVSSMQLADNNRGYIITSDGAAKTTDAGISWTRIYDNYLFAYRNIQFINESTGYITDGRFILKTTDGGTSWQKVVRLGQDSFYEVHFTDANHGWAGTSGGAIYRLLQ